MECLLCERVECNGHDCCCTGEVESCTLCQKIARTDPESWQAEYVRQLQQRDNEERLREFGSEII